MNTKWNNFQPLLDLSNEELLDLMNSLAIFRENDRINADEKLNKMKNAINEFYNLKGSTNQMAVSSIENDIYKEYALRHYYGLI